MFWTKSPFYSRINRDTIHLLMQLYRKRPLRAALFFAILFLIGACEKPEQRIGLDVQPEDDLLNLMYTDTFTIEATTVKEDSIKTDELSISLAGNYMDPVLGTVESSFSTHLRLPTNSVNFGDLNNIELDSVVLSLVYEGQVYGNLNNQTWSVKELLDPIYVDSSYYSNRDLLLGDELIDPAFATQPILPDDWVFLTETDSVVPQLRLRLQNSFGQRILNESGSSNLNNNDAFVEFFKGINISSSTTDAGVIRFNALDLESRVTLYYRNTALEDTIEFNLNINADCARYTRFKMNYDGTVLSGIENGPISGATNCFVQAGGGLKTKLEFPSLTTLNEFDQRTINSAILLIPVNTDDIEDFEQQSSLFALTVNGEGESSAIPDQLLGPAHVDGEYDQENRRYRFNVTRFVQAVIDGVQESGELFLVSSSSGVSVRRVRLNGPDAFLEDPSRNMRLVLTFSN